MAVERMRAKLSARERKKRTLDYGWTPEGRLWMTFLLPEGELTQSPVFLVPGAIRRFVAGQRFEAVAEDDTPAGYVAVNETGSSWGYGPFLRRRGADASDLLRVEFDLQRPLVRLELGGEELLADAS